MHIEVTRAVIEAMRAAARSAHPREACGLLSGEGRQITHFVETANVHPNPETHFEIDPHSLISAYRVEREGGPKVIGYFHSHPNGHAAPSQTDREHAAHDRKIWAIEARGVVTFWRDEPDWFQALSFTTIDG